MSTAPASVSSMRELTVRGCASAREAAAAASETLDGAGGALAAVRRREEELDALDHQINDGVTHAIAGVSSTDARELLSCLKFILELERIGDLLLNFANRAASLAGRLDAQDTADLRAMCVLLQRMLDDACWAFRERKLDRALAVLRADSELDRLRNLLFVRHIENPDRQPRQESFHLVFMTQELERAGDHAKNMAEEVVHLVTGRSVRHLLRATDKPWEEMFVDYMRRRETGRK